MTGAALSHRRFYAVAVSLVVLAWLAIACLWLNSPGLHYDEMIFVSGTFPEKPGGAVWKPLYNKKPVAVMVMSYMGALKGWMYRGLLSFVEPSVAAVRLPLILLAAITLLLAYRLGSEMFDRGTGLVTVVLLSTDATFLFTSRVDWGPVVIQRLCLVAGVLLAFVGNRSNRGGPVAAGLFLFGLALFDKLTFAWILAGLLSALVVTYPRSLLKTPAWRRLPFYVLAFVLPASPVLYYRLFVAPPDRTAMEAHDTHLQAKFDMLNQSFSGTVLSGPFAFQSADNPAPADDFATKALYWLAPDEPWVTGWFRPAVILALLSFPFTLFLPGARRRAFVLLFCVIAWIPMMLTEGAGAVHHLTLTYPFPHLFVAASFVSLAEWMSRFTGTRLAMASLVVATALVAQANVKNIAHKYTELVRFGGRPAFTEAIVDLHEFLADRPEQQIVIGDWGIEHQLVFLSNNKMPLITFPHAGPEDAEALKLAVSELEQPSTLVVLYASKEVSPSPMRHDLVNEAARIAGVQLQLIEVIRDRQGREMYHVSLSQPAVGDAPPRAVND